MVTLLLELCRLFPLRTALTLASIWGSTFLAPQSPNIAVVRAVAATFFGLLAFSLVRSRSSWITHNAKWFALVGAAAGWIIDAPRLPRFGRAVPLIAAAFAIHRAWTSSRTAISPPKDNLPSTPQASASFLGDPLLATQSVRTQTQRTSANEDSTAATSPMVAHWTTPIGAASESPEHNRPKSTRLPSRWAALFSVFGWRTVNGVVQHIEPVRYSPPEWPIASMIMAVGALAWCGRISFLWLRDVLATSLGQSMIGRMMINYDTINLIAGLLVGFAVLQVARLLLSIRKPVQVPVIDIRLRDDNSKEFNVRLRGELWAGGLNVGDNVKLSGFDRHGTLMVRHGLNYRTGGKIVIRYR